MTLEGRQISFVTVLKCGAHRPVFITFLWVVNENCLRKKRIAHALLKHFYEQQKVFEKIWSEQRMCINYTYIL